MHMITDYVVLMLRWTLHLVSACRYYMKPTDSAPRRWKGQYTAETESRSSGSSLLVRGRFSVCKARCWSLSARWDSNSSWQCWAVTRSGPRTVRLRVVRLPVHPPHRASWFVPGGDRPAPSSEQDRGVKYCNITIPKHRQTSVSLF